MKENDPPPDKSKNTRSLASEQRLAAIIASAMDGIITIDAEERITVFNGAAEEMFGCKAVDVMGQSLNRLIPPRYHQVHSGHIHEFGSENKESHRTMGKHIAISGLRSTGEEFPIEASISQIETEGQRFYTVILRDITERRKAEKSIREFAAIIESTEDAIISKNLQGIIKSWNPAAEKMFGYTAEEIVGRSVEVLFPPDRTSEEKNILERIGRGERIRNFETVRVRKDGQQRNVSVTISPIKDTEGKVIGASKIIRDITESKHIQEQTAEQAALLDQAQDAILVRDLNGVVLFWNKGAERLYSWTRQEAVGKNVVDLIYADARKFAETNAIVVARGDWSGELRHMTKDHRELIIEARWSLVRDSEGRPKSVLAVNTDVTEKRKIESQFLRAQRMESLGILAGGVAHDLNNILAPIMLSIDMLKEMVEKEDAKFILETIEMSARRGSDVVQQVLSFARGLDGQRIEIQPKHLLKDIERIVRDTFSKSIRLQYSLPHDIWTILGDPTQIHQILLNLCVNARDAMPNGGSLTLAASNVILDEQYVAMNIHAKAGPYVVISVTDTGTGIPKDLIEKIFEPFFTTKEIGKGTGLGLSTVLAIVKSHGGFINVYSEPGMGSTFKVYLPAQEASIVLVPDRPEIASLPRGKGELILVADDEPSLLVITRQTLQAYGYRVITATNGAEAVAAYAQNRDIAAVITDMMMPVMDGAATIYALLKIDSKVKIIAASGLNANGNVAKASGAGVKHFLAKPYTASTLLKMLREVLDVTE